MPCEAAGPEFKDNCLARWDRKKVADGNKTRWISAAIVGWLIKIARIDFWRKIKLIDFYDFFHILLPSFNFPWKFLGERLPQNFLKSLNIVHCWIYLGGQSTGFSSIIYTSVQRTRRDKTLFIKLTIVRRIPITRQSWNRRTKTRSHYRAAICSRALARPKKILDIPIKPIRHVENLATRGMRHLATTCGTGHFETSSNLANYGPAETRHRISGVTRGSDQNWNGNYFSRRAVLRWRLNNFAAAAIN